MKVLIIILFAVIIRTYLCKNINSTYVIERENETALIEEEFNFELELPKCNDTAIAKSFVVDLYFSLKPETAPLLIGKLIQSCSYYNNENDILIHDILKLIKLDGISSIEFIEWMEKVLPEDLLNNLLEKSDEFDSNEFDELNEINFIYFKQKLVSMTENITYCEFIEQNEWFVDIFDKLWKTTNAFDVSFLEIMHFEKFVLLFAQYFSDMNDLNISGVFVDSNTLVTNGVVYQKLINNYEYVKLVGITLENCKRYEFTDMTWINSHIVKLRSNYDSDNYIGYEIAKTDVLSNCIYMLKYDEEIKLIDFDVIKNEKIHLIAENFEKDWFKVGNPLICNNTLYGLAEFQSIFGLNFASFYKEEVAASAIIITSNVGYFAILFILIRLMQ